MHRPLLNLAHLASLLFILSAPLQAAEQFQWDEPRPGEYRLRLGEAPVIVCMTPYDDSSKERREETYKVYTHVYGPKSGEIITKGPGGLYPHHRGIYLGWNKTIAADQSYDFWHCPPASGVHQKLNGVPETHAEPGKASIKLAIDWNDKEDKPVIQESRTLTVSSVDGHPGWIIDVRSELHSRRGELRLEGDRQHAGLQFRAAQEVAEKESARYIRPTGYPEQPEAFQVDDSGDPPRHINLNWLTMTYDLQGKQYTVEYFEDPGLPKPSLYSERPYGRFGAFFKTVLKPDAPLVLRYRLNITEAPPESRETIQKRYDAFAAELKG